MLMGFADQYLSKQKGVIPYFSDFPSDKFRFAVIIPAYCEPHITDALESLWNCQRPHGHVEVIVVVNCVENAARDVVESNMVSIGVINKWIDRHSDPTFHFTVIERMNMPLKDAGVGLARKTGMDEAIYRFNLVNKPGGIILSFDADSQCDSNYFTAIEESIDKQPDIKGFNVYFEHPVSGSDFPEMVYHGIIDYELHLRYVNQFLRFSCFPFAYHTVGSCFGVRADVYAGQGGMSKKKAGEDFYFLHKIIPLGQFIEINTTRVVPSPRESSRVPFGTGTAINKYLAAANEGLLTYSPECFLPLVAFFRKAGQLYKVSPEDISPILDQLPELLRNYLISLRATEAIMEINANCSSITTFMNRFFRWFDAFKIVKFLNYASRNYFKQIPVREAAIRFLAIAGIGNMPETASAYELLMILREIEKTK